MSKAGIFRASALLLCFFLVAGCRFPFSRAELRPAPVSRRVPSALLAIFPQEQGTKWGYSGFAEYGHVMSLQKNQANRGRTRIVHRIAGEVDDVSGGESPRDFGFRLEYVFGPSDVRERVISADTPFPHRIRDLIMLRLPLRQGAGWRQKVRVRGESGSRTLTARITGIKVENNLTSYTVVYRVPMRNMPGGIYEEIRIYTRGKGVERFENTFGPNPEERFGYSLDSVERPQKS